MTTKSKKSTKSKAPKTEALKVKTNLKGGYGQTINPTIKAPAD